MTNPSQVIEQAYGLGEGRAVQGLDEKALWLQFKKGNELAFSVLYNKYVKRLFNYGMQWCGDRELVLDTMQELFGRLWARRNEVAEVEVVNAYLYKSFRRLLFNRISEVRRRSIFDHDDRFEVLASVEDSIILQETNAEDFNRLKRALSCLSRREREVIFLKFHNGLSYASVAEVMDLTTDSVYNLMTRALKSLRTALGRKKS